MYVQFLISKKKINFNFISGGMAALGMYLFINSKFQ